MAMYKNGEWLTQSNDAVFDTIHKPGQAPERSGIFRCIGCGREVVAEESRSLPPQNHHQHTTGQGDVRWKLAVYADHRPK
jgi:hypothetical protein